jgi:hypothetical protein
VQREIIGMRLNQPTISRPGHHLGYLKGIPDALQVAELDVEGCPDATAASVAEASGNRAARRVRRSSCRRPRPIQAPAGKRPGTDPARSCRQDRGSRPRRGPPRSFSVLAAPWAAFRFPSDTNRTAP